MDRIVVGLMLVGLLAFSAMPSAVGAPSVEPRSKTERYIGGSDAHGSREVRVRAKAVIALTDTGINPYHVVFRDDSTNAYKHPSTYIPGFPRSAQALQLSLHEKDYATAVKKDCEAVWSKVEPGRLYWFPGTKIIGGITFGGSPPLEPIDCDSPSTIYGRILDPLGHGTMTASRAVSTGYGACPQCRIVAIQYYIDTGVTPTEWEEPLIDSIRWAADHASWIDLQSNSWGPVTPLWEPTGYSGYTASTPAFVRAVEESASKHLAFWAAGNGVAFRGGAVGHPTLLAPHLTPSVIMVGGHDSGYVNTWPGFPPHVVSDSCSSWAAYHQEIDQSDETVGSGTSAATPFAAGGAARILMEARRILGDSSTGITGEVVASGSNRSVTEGPLADGELTVEEWKRLVFVSATPRPTAQREDGPPCDVVEGTGTFAATPIKWSDVPSGYPEYLHIGYGAVDDTAIELAFGILRGTAEAPDRAPTDSYFEHDRDVRETTYGVWSMS